MRFHNITKCDMLNGDGLRVVLWVSGCSHYCEGCHNPITWDENCGEVFGTDAKKEIFDELSLAYVSGLTLTGGDPLYKNNLKEITAFAKEVKIKFPNKTIWLYTGYEWGEIKEFEVMKYVDVVIDGKFEKDKVNNNLHWRGSSNQKIIEVAKYICK